jgi:arylsulfatase A-like enzyme/Flp pilus assembly protein TadD
MTGRARALAVAVVAAAASSAVFACRRSLDPAPADVNVVVITLDTLRADRLGSYGFRGVETPHLDALAAEGVLFEQATATVPLTLPSHCSIFTGLLPPRHGVRDNGASSLAEAHTTLAERMKAAGHVTGAFVGAWVLERRWGLAQGFDEYSDRFGLDQFQKRGDAVVADALRWIDGVRDRRFFAWVHLFDPHLPYDPPEPYRSRYADPYLGEVAYTDALVGRVMSRLRETGVLERTLVVVTADHGESLGEHGEATHGFFVYDATVAVPLIVRTPWGWKGRSRTQASLVDVFPTILDLVGLPAQAGVDGASLRPALVDPARDLARRAYSESFYPRVHYGWHELRALRGAGFKYIDAPRPELYDLRTDPAEARNVARSEGRRAEDMRVTLQRMAEEGAPRATAPPGPDPETRQRLAALGYVGSTAAVDPGAVLPDPKDKIRLYGLITDARAAVEAGRLADGIATLERVIAEDADILDAHLTLGGWLLKAGRAREAVASLKRAVALKPDDELAVSRLVAACRASGDAAEALRALEVFRLALERNPGNPHAWYQLATLSLEMRRTTEAEEALGRALQADPRLASAHSALGAIAYERGDLARAEAELGQALALDPEVLTARYNLARVRAAQGRPAEAEELYRAELSDNPQHGRAHFNLARLLKEKGDGAAYLAELRRGVEEAPRSGPCHFLLAHEEMKAGRFDEAVHLARRGLEVDPTSDVAPLGYYVLADVYGRRGQPAKAAEALAAGRRLDVAQGRAPRPRS